MSAAPSALWAHPPLPPGKRTLNRSHSEDKKPPSSSFGFMRRFPSVRRNSAKRDSAMDTTYESFDSLFEDDIDCEDDHQHHRHGHDNDSDIMLVATEYFTAADPSPSSSWTKRPFSSMFRSRSDGNLAAGSSPVNGGCKSMAAESRESTKGLGKYLRALSGSWKNLLNSKWRTNRSNR